jgi:hypothetical protein
VTSRFSHTALLVSGLLLVVTACGASEDRATSEAAGSRAAEPLTVEAGNAPASEASPQLEHDGVSIEVPEGWAGRVVALDFPSAVLQAANFEFAPVGVELPPGEEDPIKAMTADHALVMIGPCGIESVDEGSRGPAPEPLSLADLTFLPSGHPRVPRNHALAHASFEFSSRCLHVVADFGGAPPAPKLKDAVNGVLGSLAVAERSDSP